MAILTDGGRSNACQGNPAGTTSQDGTTRRRQDACERGPLTVVTRGLEAELLPAWLPLEPGWGPVTDAAADPTALARMRDSGVEVVVAG
jgi:hypothetical protein